MNKAFMVQGSIVSEINPNFTVEPKIPVGVYDISITRRGIFLDKISDEFVFPYKIYGLQTDFINHIIKTYNNTTGNIGVLMNGIKGTGKTVSAKILANQLQLPVIILKNMGDETSIAIDYVSTLACDCIIFMDEFEKNFSTENQEILQLMDGVYNSEFRKVFLLTTNELNVNDNLLGRPSRIRYVKQFGNLDKATVEEYIDENLVDMSAKQDIVDFIDTLTIQAAVLTAMLDFAQKQKFSRGSALYSDIDGDEIEGLEDIFFNPDAYNVLPFYNNYTEDGEWVKKERSLYHNEWWFFWSY